MTTNPTKGAERAARAILYLEREGAGVLASDSARLAGIIDRAIGLPALVLAGNLLAAPADKESTDGR